ncbi:MAG: hypothetical protein BMS9Abin37_2502 [Acidobacteriota bacterium]|nr:MAG: hypothetical protein BMS9Abin37_2502 [Acidobacteriota bacterium]
MAFGRQSTYVDDDLRTRAKGRGSCQGPRCMDVIRFLWFRPNARAYGGEKTYALPGRSIKKVYFERTFVNVSRLTFLPLTTSTTV